MKTMVVILALLAFPLGFFYAQTRKGEVAELSDELHAPRYP